MTVFDHDCRNCFLDAAHLGGWCSRLFLGCCNRRLFGCAFTTFRCPSVDEFFLSFSLSEIQDSSLSLLPPLDTAVVRIPCRLLLRIRELGLCRGCSCSDCIASI